MTAEGLNRRWKTFEISQEYVAASAFRFAKDDVDAQTIYDGIMAGNDIEI